MAQDCYTQTAFALLVFNCDKPPFIRSMHQTYARVSLATPDEGVLLLCQGQIAQW